MAKRKVHLTESQVNYCLKRINEEQGGYVLFTAQNVDNPQALMDKYPSPLPNKFYHHSTNKFQKGMPFDQREGEKLRLHIVGRLTNDVVDALVVENPNSNNPIPHITLATGDGIKPFQSNIELQNHRGEIEPLDDYVDTTFVNNMAKPRV